MLNLLLAAVVFAPGEPAVAQPRPARIINMKQPENKIEPALPNKKFKVWIACDDSPECFWLKVIAADKKIRWKKNGKVVDQIAKYRHSVFEGVDIVLLDGTDADTQVKYNLPRWHNYYPLIKFNQREKWKEFPQGQRVALMHPLTVVEWFDYNKQEYLNDFVYSDNFANGRTIWDNYKEEKMDWYWYTHEWRAFKFLISKGENPNNYRYSKPNAYRKYFDRYFIYRITTTVKTFTYIKMLPNGEMQEVKYKTTFEKKHSINFSDHDFDKIKSRYPDFELPKPLHINVKDRPLQPFWSDRPFRLVEPIKSNTIEKIRRELGYSWNY